MLDSYSRNVVPRCAVRRSRAPTPLITPRFLFAPLNPRPPPKSPSSPQYPPGPKYPTRGDRLQRHTAASIYNRRLLLSKPSPDQDAISRARIIKPSLREKEEAVEEETETSKSRRFEPSWRTREAKSTRVDPRGALLKAAVRVHKQHWAARRDALMTRILNNDNDPVNGISFSPSSRRAFDDRADGFEPDSNRETISNSNPWRRWNSVEVN